MDSDTDSAMTPIQHDMLLRKFGDLSLPKSGSFRNGVLSVSLLIINLFCFCFV